MQVTSYATTSAQSPISHQLVAAAFYPLGYKETFFLPLVCIAGIPNMLEVELVMIPI